MIIMKGIAIQTILLLLVGILVAGVIIYLVYTYTSGPSLSSYDCRTNLISWCTTCSIVSWNDGTKLSKEVADCTTKYFGYSTVQNIKCNEKIGTAGTACTGSTDCPNQTICRAVGVGTTS